MSERGLITVIIGSMFSSKTTELIKRTETMRKEGVGVAVFKPRLDNRYGNSAKLHAHNGLSISANLVNHEYPSEIFDQMVNKERVGHVVIDEAMFFVPGLLDVVKELSEMGKGVTAAGLDLDYKLLPFGIMPELIEQADEVIQLLADCYACGGEAMYTMRDVAGEQVVVGGSGIYKASCKTHHEIPG